MLIFGILVIVIALVAEPYRMVRIQVALNPWLMSMGDGYQATLAIMAFARAVCSAVASATQP